MQITPDTTLKDIAANDQMQRDLAEIILQSGVRGVLAGRGVSYDTADAVATGIRHAIAGALEDLVTGQRA